MTREADELDAASELTQQLNDAYIQNARAKARPEQEPLPDGTWPVQYCGCGDEIPPARLALGKIRCIECQKDWEAGKR